MPRTEWTCLLRCTAVTASLHLGVRRAQLMLGRSSRWCMMRRRQVANFCFPEDGWQRAASGEYLNITGRQRLNVRLLERLSPEAPLKLQAWTTCGGKKSTHIKVADLLTALHAKPAHLTLQLLSSSEGVCLTWGVQEPEQALHEHDGAPLSTSPVPSESRETLSSAGTALRGGSPVLPKRDVPLVEHNTAHLNTCSTKARVPSGLMQGGLAPLSAEYSVKGPSPVVLYACFFLLIVAWLASLEAMAAVWSQAVVPAVCLAFVLFLVCLAVCCMLTWGRQRLRQMSEEDDIDFLGRRIPFLSEEDMYALDAGFFLGRGGNASVRRILYGGVHAVRKEFLYGNALETMMREARLMLELHGAGGVPRLLALGFNPDTIIQEFVGEPYDRLLQQWSVQDVLHSLGLLCHRLEEMHAQGVVHNDIKIDNITVSGDVHQPILHVIDLGWACRSGCIAGEFTLETGEKTIPMEGFAYRCHWMAPEVRARRPVFASGDVFSLGFMLQGLAKKACMQPWVAVPLWQLGQQCTREEPNCRPSLSEVALVIAALPEKLLQCQLKEPFHMVMHL